MVNEKDIKELMTYETESKKNKIKSIIGQAQKIIEDPNKEERLKKQFCVTCFYRSTMAGQKMTYKNCLSCDKEIVFGNTNVDKVCDDCATKYSACKKCLAEI